MIDGKTIQDIQDKMDSGKAKVYTASEFKNIIRSGIHMSFEDVDVVTCGTFGVMSGTMAVLSIPVTGPGVFKRADTITLNGVPGHVGPCPNESLGLVDCVVYGTSRRDMDYGGGHLFKDMVSGSPINVVVSSEGIIYETHVNLSQIPYARMVMTRGGFKNYTGFANGSDTDVTTIFSGPNALKGRYSEASISGCGELNPLENDPNANYLHAGSSVMLNGAPGIVLGEGTRSTPKKPNLSISADMHLMRADHMGGFRTSEGPECLVSIVAAIPVTNEQSLSDLSVIDDDISLPVADVRDRVPVSFDRYSSVWNDTDVRISADHYKCLECTQCIADEDCPVNASPSFGIDITSCISCGICVSSCRGKIFRANMGSLSFNGKDIPVKIRQSSRSKAEDLCKELKEIIENKNWKLRCFDGKI